MINEVKIFLFQGVIFFGVWGVVKGRNTCGLKRPWPCWLGVMGTGVFMVCTHVNDRVMSMHWDFHIQLKELKFFGR